MEAPSTEPVTAGARGAETRGEQTTGSLRMVVKGSTLLKNGSLEYSVATWANQTGKIIRT